VPWFRRRKRAEEELGELRELARGGARDLEVEGSRRGFPFQAAEPSDPLELVSASRATGRGPPAAS
jgi:hypothetical protein